MVVQSLLPADSGLSSKNHQESANAKRRPRPNSGGERPGAGRKKGGIEKRAAPNVEVGRCYEFSGNQ